MEVLVRATAWFCMVGFHLSLWFCTVEFHLSLGHQKATLGSFLRCGFGWFGLVSRWCLAVSEGERMQGNHLRPTRLRHFSKII